MSLAMAVVQKNFIITTSDYAVTFFPMDEDVYNETGEEVPSGEMVATDIREQKAHRISDKVILIATGNSAITETLKVELASYANSDSDLYELKSMAKKVMKDLRSRKVNNLHVILENLKETLPVEDNPDLESDYWETIEWGIDDPRGLSAFLAGFKGDDVSGLVDIRADKLLEVPKGGKSYPVTIIGDTIDHDHFNAYIQALNLPLEYRTIPSFIEALSKIHAHISYVREGVNVSPECHFHILIRQGNQIEYTDFTLDTSKLYESLGLI